MLMRLGGLCFLLDSLVLAMFLPTGARLDEGSYKLKLTRQYYPSPRPLLCQMLALLEGIPISFTIDTLITSTSSSPRRFGTCYAMLLTTPPVLHLPRSCSLGFVCFHGSFDVFNAVIVTNNMVELSTLVLVVTMFWDPQDIPSVDEAVGWMDGSIEGWRRDAATRQASSADAYKIDRVVAGFPASSSCCGRRRDHDVSMF
ncbi:hypothetical protein QR685DRAFT_609002 [Neurospora intermedia]|uniref:Uncharacterized protein n=1 Tax=Neurospora intermedia TaxID=5142 RepID=A0ABR3D2E0_NEUIN